MRSLLITNGNLFSMLSLGGFLGSGLTDLKAVFITTKLPSEKSNLHGIFKLWRQSGSSYTYFKILTNKILPLQLHRQGLCGSIPELLQAYKMATPVHYVDDINAREVLQQIEQYKPDVLLSFSATQRFCNQLIEIPKRVAINAHYALLPAFAGLSPYFWYLQTQQKECGVTLHQIVSKLDAGPIIEQVRFPLCVLRSVLGVVLHQASLISPMLERFYLGETSEHHATAQDLSKRSYFRHPTRKQVHQFHKDGFRFYTKADLFELKERVRRLSAPSHFVPSTVNV